MSSPAVLLLEETRHWSHLTGTSVELFHLNYLSYMSAISFKGTDESLLPPWCQIRGSIEQHWPDTTAFSWMWNMSSSGTPSPEIHIIGAQHHALLGPGSITRVYSKGLFLALKARLVQFLDPNWGHDSFFSVAICYKAPTCESSPQLRHIWNNSDAMNSSL